MNHFAQVTFIVLVVLCLAGMWQVFVKAGKPGWAALVPLYWLYILIKIGDRPGWWMLYLLVPILNFFILVGVYNRVAQRFGKGFGFALGLIFLPFIFFPLLGFGDAAFQS